MGNPLLKQEYVHRLNLSVSGSVFQVSANYTNTKNAIFQWAELYEGMDDVTVTTYKNYNSLKKLAIVGVVSPTFGCWSPTLQASWTKMCVSKSWLNERLLLQCSVTDLFGDEKSEQLRQSYQIITNQVKWLDRRSLAFTIRYKFNSLKNHYRGSGAGDDEKDRF